MTVLYIGNFGQNNKFKGSQAKKGISICNYLMSNDVRVITVNTEKLKKLQFPVICIKLLWGLIQANKIILSLNRNGLQFANHIILKSITKYKDKQLYFITIGGWLASFIEKNKRTIKYFSNFEKIYVQAEEIKNHLSLLGLNNVKNMKNFRDFDKDNLLKVRDRILSINYKEKNQIKLVFFALIRKGKGLEIIIEAIKEYNKKFNQTEFTLDVIGPIRPEYQKEFDDILKKNCNFFSYKGQITDQNKIYETLSSYDLMAFPTYYEGEGFPTVIVESFISGLPVLASDWKYNTEIIVNEYNGVLFETKNIVDLVEKLEWISLNKNKVLEMRLNCLEEAQRYHPDVILKPILEDMSINPSSS